MTTARVERVAHAIGAAMITRQGPGEIAKAALAAAGHDPDELCTCEPGDLRHEGICEYRMLADTVGNLLNPPDADEAEVSILMTAVERAKAYIESQPCICTPEGIEDQMPCPRCAAIGRLGNEVLAR
jgi:hypothetical protein